MSSFKIKSKRRTYFCKRGNNKGQGLIEYIIIVSLVAVGSMALLQVLQQSLNYQFAHVAKALGAKSEQKFKAPEVTKSMLERKDMSHFMQEVTAQEKNSSQHEK
jgi:pilus assembly protein Flp/PilA